MGYYTEHNISVKDGDVQQYKAELEEISRRKFDIEGGSLTLEAKWYDHDTHLTRLSEQHPDVVFVLEGWGEDDQDVWRKFYHAGTSVWQKQKVVRTWPDEPEFG